MIGCLRSLTAALRAPSAGVLGIGVFGAGAGARVLALGVVGGGGLVENGLDFASLVGERGSVDAGVSMRRMRFLSGEPSGVVDSIGWVLSGVLAGVLLAGLVGTLARSASAFFRFSLCHPARRSAMSPALANFCSYGRGSADGLYGSIVDGRRGFRVGTGRGLMGADGTFGKRSFSAATASPGPGVPGRGFRGIFGTGGMGLFVLADVRDGIRLWGELWLVASTGNVGLTGVASVLRRAVLATVPDLVGLDTALPARGRALPAVTVLSAPLL